MNNQLKIQRIYCLDLLRAMAIVGVLIYHFPRPESAIVFRAISHFGFWGVDLFFVLSGYLIGQQWFRAVSTQQANVKRFFFRRLMRTIPVYLTFVFIVCAYRMWNGLELPDWRYYFFLQNFGGMEDLTITWSLCIEEQFYLVFPFIGLFLLSHKKVSFYFYTSLLFIPIMLRAGMWWHLRPDLAFSIDVPSTHRDFNNFIYFPTYMRIDAIAMGTGLAYLQIFREELWTKWLTKGKTILFFSLGAFSVAAAMSKFSFLGTTFSFTLVGLGCSGLVASFISLSNKINTFTTPWVSLIAITSYSMYITHMHGVWLGEVISQKMGFAQYSWQSSCLTIFSMIILCSLMYLGVERPFLRLRDRLDYRWRKRQESDTPLSQAS